MSHSSSNHIITSMPSCGFGDHSDMTFDGCYYYALKPCSCEVIRYDSSFKHHDCITVCREYSCICYDKMDCCFWAAANNCSCKIYKLDACLNEIDCIPLSFTKSFGEVIVGISYCCCDDSLLIASVSSIFKLCKEDNKLTLVKMICESCITSIDSACPGFIFSYIQNNKQYIKLCDACGNCLKRREIPQDYIVKGLLNASCKENFPNLTIKILTVKCGCYPYLIEVTLTPCILGYLPCCCGFFDCCEDCHPTPKPPHISDSCEQVLESIALVETALAHILNAEGEKIQKAIASTDDMNTLLCINREVRETIVRATHLEQILFDKLSVLSESGCFCPADCGKSCHPRNEKRSCESSYHDCDYFEQGEN